MMRGRVFWYACVFLVACLSSVNAANLSVSVNVEYDDVASFVDENLFEVVLIPSGFVPKVVSYDGSSSSFVVGQYDRLDYLHPASSTVVLPNGESRILSSGQSLVLTQSGVYVGTRISDNASWEVSVSAFSYPEVSWSTTLPIGFNPRTHSGSFVLDEETRFNFSYSLENFTASGEYGVVVELDGLSFDVERSVEVRERTDYSSAINYSGVRVVAGSSGLFATLELSASGNKPGEASVTITGDASSFLSVRRDAAVYPDLTLDYPVVYNVPVDVVRGLYQGVLTVNLNSDIDTYAFNFTVEDDTPPNITLSLPQILVEGVRANATVQILDADEYEFYVSLGPQVLSTEDRGSGFYRFFFTPENDTLLEVCASDESGNDACVRKNIVTVVDDWFTENRVERVNTGRTGGEVVHYLGKREYDGVYSYSYELVENTSQIEFWLGDRESQTRWFEGEVLNQSGVGPSNLHVRMDADGEYTLIVRVVQPDDGDGVDEMRLTGRFRQYTVPEQFELNLPGLVEPGECTPVEGLGFEDSFLSCQLRYRFDYDISQISVPVTPAQLEEIEAQADASIAEFEQREGVFVLIILLLAGGVVFTLGVLYVAGQSRYIRRRG